MKLSPKEQGCLSVAFEVFQAFTDDGAPVNSATT
jgi:hypothetical protein